MAINVISYFSESIELMNCPVTISDLLVPTLTSAGPKSLY